MSLLLLTGAIAALALDPAPSAPAASQTTSLKTIDDDYNTALAQARAAGHEVIVVDLWAPWCHSCLSMKNFVLTDARVLALGDKATLLAVDTEKERNQALVERFKPTAWPTFLVLDVATEQVLARLTGSATAPEFARFVREAKQVPAALREAEVAMTAGEADKAMALFDKALSPKAIKGLPASTIGRSAGNFMLLLSAANKGKQCAARGTELASAVRDSYYEAALWMGVGYCELGEKAPRKAVMEKVKSRLDALLASPTVGLSADDASDVYDMLGELDAALGDAAAAKQRAQARLALLEAAAKNAKTPTEAQTFDAHRTDVYLALGRTSDAIAMLQQSEKDAPEDYNPPARLARVYLAAGDLSGARAAIGRAEARVYGPRAAVVAILAGDIAEKQADKLAARAAYERARRILEAQPRTLGVERRLGQVKTKLAKL